MTLFFFHPIRLWDVKKGQGHTEIVLFSQSRFQYRSSTSKKTGEKEMASNKQC